MSKGLRPCGQPGCFELTTEGYCDAHRRGGKGRSERRKSASDRGYNWLWHRKAKLYKSRHPLCVVCELEGRTTETALPHHIEPVSGGGKMHVGDDGMLPVCHTCHARVEGLGWNWRSVVKKP